MMTSLVAAAVLLGGACSDGDVEVTPAQTPTSDAIVVEPTEVPTAVPTATPEPPEPTAVPTTAPTAVPELTDDEQAAVAAWERYVARVTDARSADPEPESLDIASYATGSAVSDLSAMLADLETQGVYWSGTAAADTHDVVTREDGSIVLSGCLSTDLQEHSRADDSVTLTEGPLDYNFRARVDPVGAGWLVGAVELEDGPCVAS